MASLVSIYLLRTARKSEILIVKFLVRLMVSLIVRFLNSIVYLPIVWVAFFKAYGERTRDNFKVKDRHCSAELSRFKDLSNICDRAFFPVVSDFKPSTVLAKKAPLEMFNTAFKTAFLTHVERLGHHNSWDEDNQLQCFSWGIYCIVISFFPCFYRKWSLWDGFILNQTSYPSSHRKMSPLMQK